MKKVDFKIESWPLRSPFKISGKTFYETNLLLTTITDSNHCGRGEGVPVFYLGETVESIYEQALSVKSKIENGCTREELQKLLPSGAARNSIDCAMWDLEAKQQGISVFEMLFCKKTSVDTVFTVGIDSPENMAKSSIEIDSSFIKVKLDSDVPIDKITAIRNARPDATIVVDVNQGWTFEELKLYAPQLASLNVAMLEQPLPRAHDDVLESYDSPIPLCADESCLDTSDLGGICEKYSMVNIKLDKTGGLTEAYELATMAKDLGLELMVGNFQGTSLGMAPAYMIATMCKFVDLDGPFLLKEDREHGLTYKGSQVFAPNKKLWG